LELENVELYERLSEFFEVNLTETNVISRFKRFDSIGCSWERGLEFIVSYLMDIDESSLFELNHSLLSRIFVHSSLRLRSEAWLYEQIVKQSSKDFESFSLLEFVQFEYLSQSSIE
jgi:hypothetical protein